MKITCLCGSLDPGRDGVGDYTRRLAEATAARGHTLQLISLNDPVTTGPADEGALRIVRFRSALALSDERARALQTIAAFEPDVVSLQFVPFAFHARGLNRELLPFLEAATPSARLQVMFHELWLGEKPGLPWKHRVLGFLQRRQILRLLRHLRPGRIHTSNALYREALKRRGVEAEVLPLFGNIPILDSARADRVAETLLDPYPPAPTERLLLFPFSQPADWAWPPMLEKLAAAARSADVSLRLIQVGGNAEAGRHWPGIAARAEELGWTCRRLGPRGAEEISALMQRADLGVSAAHPGLAEKSGAVVAMREHGLEVFCTGALPESRYPVAASAGKGLLPPTIDPQALAAKLAEPVRHPPSSRLSAVAQAWVDALHTLVNHG